MKYEDISNELFLENEISEDMLFSDFMRLWLDIIVNQIQTSTFGTYELVICNSIIPFYERVAVTLADLKPKHIQAYYNMLTRRGLASGTVYKHHQVIHKALKYLVKIDVLPSNPADKVELPKKQKHLPNFYRKDELEKLFEVSKNHRIGLIILLTAFYGLRRGEVIGLKWDAFDFEEDTFTIKHTVTYSNLHGKSVIIRADRAKTASSLRTLPLVPSIKEKLLSYREDQIKNHYLSDEGYVFVKPSGELMNPNYVSEQFQTLLKRNNLRRIRFHDLRHSCASLLVANGVPMKMVQDWLGHSNMATTANIYSHLDYSSRIASANVMKDILCLPK